MFEVDGNNQLSNLEIEEIKNYFSQKLHHSPDLYFYELPIKESVLIFVYMKNLIDDSSFNQFILSPALKLAREIELHAKELRNNLLTSNSLLSNDGEEITKKLLEGFIYIYIQKGETGVLANASKKTERGLEKAETESLVFGPKIAFTESLNTNISIVRQNILTEELCADKLTVGKRNETEIRLVYLKGLADEDSVEYIKEKINNLEVNEILDTSVLAQLIEDNSYTLFPQYLQTELPDRVTYSLEKGMIAVFVDRSPMVLLGPVSFFHFFESTEDVYMRWNMGSFIRFLRYLTMFLSILLTPAYVAVITYHYEMIPSTLIVSLGESRSKVPFSPIFEAFLLEIMIELLREAGARLPTKVGQTMGIVGGIVLGQAAVEAGFTSNILIIVVALSALGSFTAPSYLMGTAIRVTRFPILVLGGMWGGIGIAIGLCFLLIHLIKLTSAGRPYLQPIYPLELRKVKNTVIRLPIELIKTNPEKKGFFSFNEKYAKDIDE
ncbi:spore germination protein [Sutcliffiella halmapala]|uniref:spore germination protein n=1 Tax=Sutcliffiella halmapala TaxID=79882 RepID=UPI000994C1D5|nr:spore germination protein [Sutcliffiella halmapala]